jgi:ABC-2 type transport system ATP-binding protein
VLRAGKLVAVGTVAELRGRARQRVEVWFEDDPPAAELRALPGLADPIVDDHRFTANLSGPIQPLLELLARHRVSSMLVEEPDLDEAFIDLYGGAA